MEELVRLGVPLAGSVSSDAIERALAGAWQQASARANRRHPPTRTHVLTLVVVVPAVAAAPLALDALARLAHGSASRTIVLIPNAPIAPKKLQVWYNTACDGVAESDGLVCDETIVLAASALDTHHLAPLTDQLLLTDLPAFLWWVGDLSPDDALFQRLIPLVDRVIVDSATFHALGPALARLAHLTRRRVEPCALSDLSWARLTPWRELVSQFFDAPALRAYLGQIDRVAIGYAAKDRSGLAEGLLLLGWLAASLHWEIGAAVPSLDRPIRGRLRRGSGTAVEVALEPVAGKGPAGLRRVALRAGPEVSFVVVRAEDGTHALTEASLPGAPPLRRMVADEPTDLSRLLASELTLFGHDHVYEAALAATVAFVAGTAG